MRRPSPLQTTALALSALALPLLAAACSSPERAAAAPPMTEAEQARAITEAKAKARDAAIADLYEQWRYQYVQYRKAVETRRAASAAAPAPADSVRSLDELLRDQDPESYDPALKALRDRWLTESQQFDRRLRELQNDPETDLRSPLRADVREALAPPR